MDVVVGVAGGKRSDAAVLWGAQEAARWGEPLVLVHAFVVPAIPSVAGPLRTPEMHQDAEAACERVLQRAKHLAEREAPGLEVRTDAVRGVAKEVLPTRATEARVLALGVHPSHVMHRIGGTVTACLRHAPCPVVVVSQPEDE